jgi:hypothetical protein
METTTNQGGMRMQRVTEYNKLQQGDLVRIKGEHGTFKVMWVDLYDAERPAEVTVVGGSSGRNAWRTFTENRVTKRPRRQQVAR